MGEVAALRLNVLWTQQLASIRDLPSRNQLLEALVKQLHSFSPGSAEFIQLSSFLNRQLHLSPFDDVKQELQRLMSGHLIQKIEPSRWFTFSLEASLDSDIVQKLSVLGRPTNFGLIMSLQPELSKRFAESYELMMSLEGPLPVIWRHYLGIQAASRFSCEYLVSQEIEHYIANGGDLNWLTPPFSGVPKKIQAICSIFNARLAHEPWTVDSVHFEQLMSESRCSTAELCHALVILSTFHALPSLVYGLGTESESSPTSLAEPDWSPEDPLPACFNDTYNNRIISRLVMPHVDSTSAELDKDQLNAYEGFGALSEEALTSPLAGASGGASVVLKRGPARSNMWSDPEKSDLQTVMTQSPKWSAPLSAVFRSGDETQYEDIRIKDARILHSVNFNWEDHAVVILSQGLRSLADCLGSEYSFTTEYTNSKVGDIPADTRTIRDALAKYCQRMFGICHDDYPYDQLNKILPLLHKVFLKKVACFPERVTKGDFCRTMVSSGLSLPDMIHYLFIVFETRRVVELTFAMRALAKMQVI